MIETFELSKQFGALKAVDRLTLRVGAGELFAFLGPNAAGKTTTIRMIAGLLRPSSGRCLVCGHDVQREPEAAKALLGYVPDFPFLYDKLTAGEFMQFVANLFALEPAVAARRTAALFDTFHLEPSRHELTENLSHGTRQRLAIAAALLHEPQVIMMDEPMVGLDPLHARIVKDELRARSRRGATVFLSTHTLSIAEEIADRIGIIDHGRLVASGTVAELRQQTAQGGPLEEVFLSIVASDRQNAHQ